MSLDEYLLTLGHAAATAATGAATASAIAAFKRRFARNFPFVPDPLPNGAAATDYVTDDDITEAMTEARASFNRALFDTPAAAQTPFMLLAAHWLSLDLQAAAAGIAAKPQLPVTSRSVGSVSESYAVPQWMQDNPILAPLTVTYYGFKYATIIAPLLVGNVQAFQGTTWP